MGSFVNKIIAVLQSVAPAAGKTLEANQSDTRRRIWRRWRIAGILLILVAITMFLRVTVLRPPLVSVAEVKHGNVVAEVEGTGTVTADALANVASKITGRVEKVFVAEGDTVKKDQILATLDQTDLRHQVGVAQAHLTAAMATARTRQYEWTRENSLVNSGAVGIEETQQYQERYAVAQSAVQAAKAELGYAEYNLSLTQIRSLSGGIVTKRWVVPGASVVPGQTMFTVADTRLIYVETYIDQSFTGKIHKGETASVILRGRENQPLTGYVLRIRPQADAATEEMVAEAAFSIPSDQFQLGQWANVYIQVGEVEDALVVPQTALMPMGNDMFIWVVDANDKLRRERVTVSARSPRKPMVAVAGNLQPGDRVVLMPMGLQPGKTVRPVLVEMEQMMGMAQ